MNDRTILGIVWLVISAFLFIYVMEPGTSPSGGEIMGMLILFLIVEAIWSAFIGMLALLFVRGVK